VEKQNGWREEHETEGTRRGTGDYTTRNFDNGNIDRIGENFDVKIGFFKYLSPPY